MGYNVDIMCLKHLPEYLYYVSQGGNLTERKSHPCAFNTISGMKTVVPNPMSKLVGSNFLYHYLTTMYP
jgi:hypothetical protein